MFSLGFAWRWDDGRDFCGRVATPKNFPKLRCVDLPNFFNLFSFFFRLFIKDIYIYYMKNCVVFMNSNAKRQNLWASWLGQKYNKKAKK